MFLRRSGWRNARAQLGRRQIFHDPCGRLHALKIVKFLKKSDATSALRRFLADFIVPEKIMIGALRTDNGAEFEGNLQRLLDKLRITHEHTPSDMPQYNKVAERALRLPREKTIALIQDLKEGDKNWLWAEAMNYACDLSNMGRTTLNDDGISSY